MSGLKPNGNSFFGKMLVTLIMVLEVQATPSTENDIYYVRF